jgi:hypothetical protein
MTGPLSHGALGVLKRRRREIGSATWARSDGRTLPEGGIPEGEPSRPHGVGSRATCDHIFDGPLTLIFAKEDETKAGLAHESLRRHEQRVERVSRT